MKKTFFSHGKLLLTAEYFVLDGALALAIPTQLGQEFSAEEIDGNNTIFWNAYHENNRWLSAKIDFSSWEILETNIPKNTDFILKTLQNIQILNNNIFVKGKDYHFETNLQFPANFGLGSSSTLMANLAKWANIDPFQLNEMSLGGSGYDVAVAMENSAILYELKDKKRKIETIEFNPNFKNELIFIHLNQKQDSREGIQLYKNKEKNSALISEFSELTKEVLVCENIENFSKLMTEHEEKVAQFLGLKTIKEKEFSDCPTFLKSLGAWGGDFVMSSKFDGYREYFAQKGFHTIFNYNDLVL